MDTKNSPLALLAQTCSQIGSDAPNPKLVATMEKSMKSAHKSDILDKSSPGSHSTLSNSSNESHPRSSFKPYESTFRERSAITPEDYRSHSASNRTRTPKQLHLPHTQSQNGRCDSNQSAASPRASPITSNHARKSMQQHQPINLEKNSSPTGNNRGAVTKESTSTSSRSTQNSPLYSTSKLTDAAKESAVGFAKLTNSMPVTTSSASIPPFFGAYGPSPYPMDLMTASALMSPHHAMLKAAMNPYLNYTQRMKLPTNGADAIGCRDPFCTGCALSPPTPHAIGKCPPGCTQCDHSTSSSAAATSKQNYAHQMSQAFAHAQLAALAAASQMPFVCNWIGGDATYCGKRFTASDDLLQHLRTHTASMPLESLNPATAGLPPNHPLFQRTYPTPPLSPLSSNRYHPYGKASLLPPSLQPQLSAFPIPHPSLAPYYPFNMYGSRLGSTPSMHP